MRKRIIFLTLMMLMINPLKVKADEIHKIWATAYSLNGITATGQQTKEGRTVASKPEWFGDVMYIWEDPGDGEIHPENFIGVYVVEDTGSKNIREGKVIDVYISDLDRAKQFGSKRVIIQVIKSEG